MPPSISISFTKRASPGLSSMRSILMISGPGLRSFGILNLLASITLGSFSGQFDDCEPEVFNRPDYCKKTIKIHRLVDIAIRMEVIGFEYILLRRGSGQNHHWNPFQI